MSTRTCFNDKRYKFINKNDLNVFLEICLEAVNLSDVITEEDKEKREDIGDYINRFIKYTLYIFFILILIKKIFYF